MITSRDTTYDKLSQMRLSELTALKNELNSQFAYDNWKNASFDYRKESLQALENYYAYSQGRPACEVVPTPLESNQFGFYDPNNNKIAINDDFLIHNSLYPGMEQLDSNMQCYDTIAHEGRHAYQKYAMDHPERCEDQKFVSDMLKNEGHYFRDGDEYFAQPQEKDASSFANKETLDAFDANEPGMADYQATAFECNGENAEQRMLEKNPNAIDEMNATMERGCAEKGIDYKPFEEQAKNDYSYHYDPNHVVEYPESSESGGNPKVLSRDPDEMRAAAERNIEDRMDMVRDDLRDKGYEDGPEMEAIVDQERAKDWEEFNQTAFGYNNEKPDDLDEGKNNDNSLDNQLEPDLDNENQYDSPTEQPNNEEDSQLNDDVSDENELGNDMDNENQYDSPYEEGNEESSNIEDSQLNDENELGNDFEDNQEPDLFNSQDTENDVPTEDNDLNQEDSLFDSMDESPAEDNHNDYGYHYNPDNESSLFDGMDYGNDYGNDNYYGNDYSQDNGYSR